MLLDSGWSLWPLEVPVGKPLRWGESVAENHQQHPQRVLSRQPRRQRIHAGELPLWDRWEDARLRRLELGAGCSLLLPRLSVVILHPVPFVTIYSLWNMFRLGLWLSLLNGMICWRQCRSLTYRVDLHMYLITHHNISSLLLVFDIVCPVPSFSYCGFIYTEALLTTKAASFTRHSLRF